MSKTPGDFFEFEKNGLLMQAGKIIYLERFFSCSSFEEVRNLPLKRRERKPYGEP